MPAGPRDAHALAAAQALTEAAARMRAARDKTLETRVELDGDAVAAMRRDLADSLAVIANEVDGLKRALMALRDAAEAEIRRAG